MAAANTPRSGFKTPCWIWQRALTPAGYGKITRNGKTLAAYWWFYDQSMPGGVPDGMDLHHLCEQPACVRPEHLEPMTRAAHRQAHSAYPDRAPRPRRVTGTILGDGALAD